MPSYSNSNSLFAKVDKLILKFILSYMRLKIAKTILKKKHKSTEKRARPLLGCAEAVVAAGGSRGFVGGWEVKASGEVNCKNEPLPN